MEKLYTDEIPSGSASVMIIIRLYLKLLILKWSPIPQPKQFNISFMVSDFIASANSSEVLFFTLPLRGIIACAVFLASFPPPAAESECRTRWLFLRLKSSNVSTYVPIISLLSNNGDSRYTYDYLHNLRTRLINITY